MAYKVITVLPGQSLWDIAVQEYGDASGAGQIIADNLGVVNFADQLSSGLRLKIDPDKVLNKDVVNILKERNIKPAHAVSMGRGFSDGFSEGFK